MTAFRKLCAAAAMMIISAAGYAQTYNNNTVYLLPGFMCSHNGDFYVDGIRVPESQLIHYFGDDNFYNTYVGAKKQRTAGKALLGVGIPTMVLGIIINANGYAADSDAAIVAGGLMTAVGAISTSVGIPILAVGNGRMNWLAEDYNYYASRYYGQRRKPTLNLTGARRGVGMGLALNF